MGWKKIKSNYHLIFLAVFFFYPLLFIYVHTYTETI